MGKLRLAVLVALGFVVLFAAACGGDSKRSDAPQVTASDTGGVTVTPTGTGPAAPVTPTTTTPDDGTTSTNTPPDTGGGTTTGPTTPATPPAPVTSPPTDECAGLMPTVGTPVELAQVVSDIPFCHAGTSNGLGTAVAFGIGLHHLSFEVHPMSGGAVLGFISVDHHDTGPVYNAIQPSTVGFHALTGTGVESVADRGVFSAYDDHAGLITRGGLDGDPRIIKADPAGGTAMLTLSGPLYTPTYHLEIADASGHRTAGTVLDVAAGDLAVATDGHILVVAGSRARWFDHDAKPITGWFDFQYAIGPAVDLGSFSRNVLDPLADGSIALHEGPTWTLVFPNGVATTRPSPAWLVERPGTDAFVILGGKANALVRLPSGYPCGGGDSFEVVAPSGRSCGNVLLSSPGGCSQVTFGRDGTAFTLSVQFPAPGTTGNQLCTWRWWPGLVR